jgi:RNA 2',3'-cyclic 3'-phosphodiesterase
VSLPASLEGRERPRLFCALTLPDDTVEALVAWQERELSGGRIVVPANLHVTVAFLGGRPAEELAPIARELREAASAADRPVLRVRGYRETRSVGMLVFDDEEERATRFAEDVHGRLARLGVYEPEDRKWLPHVTVLRFRERPRLHPELPELGAVSPSEAAVYHSLLRPTGAQYEILETAPLGGR